MFSFNYLLAAAPLFAFLALVSSAPSSASSSPAVNTTDCNGKTYVYEQLAGYGFLPSDARDKAGDTLGGIGSSIAIDKNSWHRIGNTYKGLLYALPDRGWNTNGTLNYQNRVHKIEISFTPAPSASVAHPSKPNLRLTYLDTILFTDPSGVATSGLDADFLPPYKHVSSSPVPSVNYTGDGFGGTGPGGFRISLDSEGLVLAHDGSFYVSDEYGDYIYHFSPIGRMLSAIEPPPAFLPLRNNSLSFSADSPPIYDPALAPIPADNPTGRDNNQGLEGLTTNPQGTKLYALAQSALNQDGGLKNKNSRYARLLVYDITSAKSATQEAEFVVTLAPIDPSDSGSKIAHQSEIHYVSPTQLLVLARDSNAGRGQSDTQSVYRHVDVVDFGSATDVKGKADCPTCQVASTTGVLLPNVTAAQYCQWLDFNVNSQLQRFGVHNGGAQDGGLLNEKWESLALLPVNPAPSAYGNGGEDYFLFSFSDNDFITQNGYMNGGKFRYKDASGFDLLNQALVFKVRLPSGVEPLVG